LDDAWIHLSYAKSLLRYGYFTYNPGEVETGATSPLWAAILALALAVLRNPVLAAKAAGVALGMACVAASFVELRKISGRTAAWIGALLLALSPMWALSCASGMEIPLTGLLLVVLIGQIRSSRPGAAGAAMGLLFLARPDMALPAFFGGLLLVWSLWLRGARRDGKADGSRALPPGRSRLGQTEPGALRGAAMALAVVLPWLLYCRLGTGHWLPTTFYVKAGHNFHFGLDKFRIFRDMLEHNYWPTAFVHDPVNLLLLLVGGLGALAGARRHPAILAWLAFPLLHIAGWAMISPDVDNGQHAGEYLTFCLNRYYLPAYPVIFGLAGLGAGVFARGFLELGRRLQTGLPSGADRAVRATMVALLLGMLAVGNYIGWWTYVGPLWLIGSGWHDEWLFLAEYNQRACQNINELQEATGRWIAANIPPTVTVATQDAGAVRYFTENPLVDLWGLNSHRYAFAPRRAEYLRQHQVRFVALFAQGKMDPLFDLKTRTIKRFISMPFGISEGDTMDIREVLDR
jgi:hypothetical protein